MPAGRGLGGEERRGELPERRVGPRIPERLPGAHVRRPEHRARRRIRVFDAELPVDDDHALRQPGQKPVELPLPQEGGVMLRFLDRRSDASACGLPGRRGELPRQGPRPRRRRELSRDLRVRAVQEHEGPVTGALTALELEQEPTEAPAVRLGDERRQWFLDQPLPIDREQGRRVLGSLRDHPAEVGRQLADRHDPAGSGSIIRMAPLTSPSRVGPSGETLMRAWIDFPRRSTAVRTTWPFSLLPASTSLIGARSSSTGRPMSRFRKCDPFTSSSVRPHMSLACPFQVSIASFRSITITAEPRLPRIDSRKTLVTFSSSVRCCSSSLIVESSSFVDWSSSFIVSSSSFVEWSSSFVVSSSSFVDWSSSFVVSSSSAVDCTPSYAVSACRFASSSAVLTSR